MRYWKYINVLPSTREGNLRASDFDEFISRLPKTSPDTVIPAGYTYFGQFIAHDLSLMDITDVGTNGHPSIKVDELVQRRRPALDLDSMYGAGFEDSHVPYDVEHGKFILGKTLDERSRDLPRQHNHIPLIADPRNDDNVIVAQMQVLFMNFHNRVVDTLISQGIKGGEILFNKAREEVTRNYIDLVLYDFAGKLLPKKVHTTVVKENRGLLTFLDPDNPALAVEFAAAAFRLHPMVRPGYILNDEKKSLVQLFQLTGTFASANPEKKIFPLDNSSVINWKRFFEFNSVTRRAQKAKPLSPVVPTFDFGTRSKSSHDVGIVEINDHDLAEKSRTVDREGKVSLFMRSTLRGMSLSLPTGQEVVRYLKHDPRFSSVAKEMDLKILDSNFLNDLNTGNKLKASTPLWLYLMLEAYGTSILNRPITRFGVLGGWLVADSLVAAAKSVKLLNLETWDPRDSVIYGRVGLYGGRENRPEHLDFRDLVRFVYPEDFTETNQ